MKISEQADVTQGVIQAVGEVEASGEAGVTVSTAQGILRARLAFSCLVQPVTGDIVLLSRRGAEAYVLSVLERCGAAPVEVRLDRSLQLSVAGDAELLACGSARLGGGRSAALEADQVTLRGEAVDIAGDRITLVGRACSWLADTLEGTARVITQIAERLSVRARSHHRQVEELELVRVGHLDLRAEQLLNVNAGQAIVKSRELVKVDGKQIQLG